MAVMALLEGVCSTNMVTLAEFIQLRTITPEPTCSSCRERSRLFTYRLGARPLMSCLEVASKAKRCETESNWCRCGPWSHFKSQLLITYTLSSLDHGNLWRMEDREDAAVPYPLRHNADWGGLG